MWIKSALEPPKNKPPHPSLTPSASQISTYSGHLSKSMTQDGHVPCEWIVDVCDESGGWFIGTALSYYETPSSPSSPSNANDSSSSSSPTKSTSTVGHLDVVIPDPQNPQWRGEVTVNFKTVRLIECCDQNTQPLFMELCRSSIVPVDWEVEWAQTTLEQQDEDEEEDEDEDGNFVEGEASWLVRLMNAIICIPNPDEDKEEQDVGKQDIVVVPCDPNLRLLRCNAGNSHPLASTGKNCSGVGDFERLVMEGVVDWSGEAPEPEVYRKSPVRKRGNSEGRGEPPPPLEPISSGQDDDGEVQEEDDAFSPPLSQLRESHLTALTNLYLDMRECMGHALQERERRVQQRKEMIATLVEYVFGGELGKGVELMEALREDDGTRDPTKESMVTVSQISKALNSLRQEAEVIFTDKKVRVEGVKNEIKRMRGRLRDIKTKEEHLLDRLEIQR